MSTIRTATLLGRLVDLDVLDDQVAGVEAFGVGVCFRVLEEAEEELGGFFGPAGFGDAELFSCTEVGGQYVASCIPLCIYAYIDEHRVIFPFVPQQLIHNIDALAPETTST